jgi:trans-aconitate methyltransferase
MPVPPASNSEGRDDWERHWTEYSESAEENPAQRWRRILILKQLNLVPGSKLLDVGSGQGDLARDVLKAHPAVELHGLELSSSGVAQAASKVPGATFHQVDLLSNDPLIASLEGWADRLVCAEVLEHVDDPQALLENALRHAAPGARMVVTVPAGPRSAFDVHIGHRRHYDKSSLRELLESAGLRVVTVDSAGFPFFNLYKIAVVARGRKLVDDVDHDRSISSSPAARLLLRLFDKLFTFNRSTGSFGWQMIAVATCPEAG